MELRKVAIYEYKRAAGKNVSERVSVGNGMFHQFGIDYEEFESGLGGFSTAIVEMPDGTVLNIPVELITFNN